MTLQDALKSGKRFKRPEHTNNRWFFIDGVGLVCDTSDNKPSIFKAVSLLAEDWELQPVEKEAVEKSCDVVCLNQYKKRGNK